MDRAAVAGGILGKCYAMCPQDEMHMREKEGLLHPLEILSGTECWRRPSADPDRVVKKYTRSAAGVDLCRPDRLRPGPVLLDTVKHLYDVSKDKRFSNVCIYNFVSDRMRAIRQDMIVQCLDSADSIPILEPIVKFHIVYGYILCSLPIDEFDPVLHFKRSNEYLKSLLLHYDELEKENCSSDPADGLENRSSFEAIYLLRNLGDETALTRYLNLSREYRNEILKLAYQISISHIDGNWIRQIKLINRLPIVELCAILVHLPVIRKKILEVMSHGFNKISTFPLTVLKDNLLFDDLSEIEKECQYFNIEVTEGSVKFNKCTFHRSKRPHESLSGNEIRRYNGIINYETILQF